MQLNGQLNAIDLLALPLEQAKQIETLKRQALELRLDLRDYELAETRNEQLKNAEKSKACLAELEKSIVSLGDIFGPADVAQFCAGIANISDNVR